MFASDILFSSSQSEEYFSSGRRTWPRGPPSVEVNRGLKPNAVMTSNPALEHSKGSSGKEESTRKSVPRMTKVLPPVPVFSESLVSNTCQSEVHTAISTRTWEDDVSSKTSKAGLFQEEVLGLYSSSRKRRSVYSESCSDSDHSNSSESRSSLSSPPNYGSAEESLSPSRPPKSKTQAYAKLQGDSFEYYIRSFSVILGRSSSNDHGVDCALGSSKSISRRHAAVTFNLRKGCFEIQCYGKHPLMVNGRRVFAGSPPVELNSKTHIQIGDVCFFFLLPKRRIADSDSSDSSYGSPLQNSDVSRPSLPTKMLIARAILSSPERKLTAHDIYSRIMDEWPYFRSLADRQWKNCIRHNLSVYPGFVKLPNEDSAYKGSFWTVVGTYEDVALPARKRARA